MQRLAPRSRWRQRLTRRSWICSCRPVCPQPRADPPPAPQPDRHDHPLGAERDVDHGRARAGASSRLNAVVTRTSSSSRAADLQTASSLRRGRRRVARVLRNLRELPEAAARGSSARRTPPFRPPLHPQVERRPTFARRSECPCGIACSSRGRPRGCRPARARPPDAAARPYSMSTSTSTVRTPRASDPNTWAAVMQHAWAPPRAARLREAPTTQPRPSRDASAGACHRRLAHGRPTPYCADTARGAHEARKRPRTISRPHAHRRSTGVPRFRGHPVHRSGAFRTCSSLTSEKKLLPPLICTPSMRPLGTPSTAAST